MIKVRGSGRIETPEKKLLRSATTALRPKTKVVLPEKHLDVGAIPKREAAAMRAAFSASESRAELRHVIDRETALREAPATNSEAQVDKYRKTSHNASAMGLLHEYLRTTLGVPESLVPELAADMHALALARVKAEVARRAAPKLSEAQLTAFKKHAAANQWNPESKPKVSPSAFIKETFKEWLGRGLTRKHIEDAQENLAQAYSTEVCRSPSARIDGLYVRPHKLPAGTPRLVVTVRRVRHVADLPEKEAASERAKKTETQRRWRTKRQSAAPAPAM
jgi:hypothetical protein